MRTVTDLEELIEGWSLLSGRGKGCQNHRLVHSQTHLSQAVPRREWSADGRHADHHQPSSPLHSSPPDRGKGGTNNP